MTLNVRKFAADPLAFIDALVIPSAVGQKRFAEVMAPHQREWFSAIAPSLLAVAAGKPPPIGRFWTERSKGGSKDSDAACVLLWLLAFSRVKLDMQVGAADRDQALELKKAAVDVLRLNDWLSQRVESQAWTLSCPASGSECAIIAADVAGSHGARPDIVILNELSHVTKEEFASNLLDNASKKPNGLVIVATNAGFTGTWQYSWREMARESDRWHFNQFAQPAPWLSDAEVEEAKRRNSRSRFDRLFWGVWVSGAGDAIDSADIQACIDSDLAPMGRREGWFYVAGLDLSVKHDHSGLVVLAGNRATQQLQLAYCESWKPDPTTGQVNLLRIEKTILDMNQRYGFSVVGVDPFQAALMMQRLALQRVKMKEVPFTGGNLNLMASTMLDVFRSRRIRLYNHPQLTADLGRLTIVERSYGYRLEATHTDEGHADVATALAIALPLAVDLLGTVPIRVGAIGDDWDGRTPYERAMHAHAVRADAHAREMQRLHAGGSNADGREEIRAVMSSLRNPF